MSHASMLRAIHDYGKGGVMRSPKARENVRLAYTVRMGENGNMLRKTAVRYRGKVDSAGRVLIPAELREKMDVKPGTMVTITGGRGRIVVESRSVAVRAAQKYFRGLAPESEIWSEELIAERRREARRELAD